MHLISFFILQRMLFEQTICTFSFQSFFILKYKPFNKKNQRLLNFKLLQKNIMANLPLIITVDGQINECITTTANNTICVYHFVHGQDWSVGPGQTRGSTHNAKRGSDNICVLNFPINVSFKGSKPYGWPQLIVAVYGTNILGNDVIIGYGAIHVPTTPGRHELEIPLFTPASSSIMQKIIGFFSGTSPEYIHLDFLAKGADREVTKTVSQGKVTVTLNVLMRGLQELDLIVQKEKDL